jgi:hypothetical protein
MENIGTTLFLQGLLITALTPAVIEQRDVVNLAPKSSLGTTRVPKLGGWHANKHVWDTHVSQLFSNSNFRQSNI